MQSRSGNQNTFNNVIISTITITIMCMIWNILFKPSIITAIIPAAMYICFGYIYIRYEPFLFMLTFLFYYSQMTAIISGIYIESGTFIPEEMIYSEATGSTARLVLFHMIFIVTLIYCIKKLLPKVISKAIFYKISISDTICYFFYCIAAISLLVGLTGILIYGTPLLLKISRFQYYLIINPIFLSIIRKYYIIPFIAGYIIAIKKDNRLHLISCISILLLLVVILILYGDKFSALSIYIYLFFFPYLTLNLYKRINTNPIPLKKPFFILLVTLLFFLPLIYYHYSNEMAGSRSAVLEQVTNRIFALQGHVWWGVDSIVNSGSYYPSDQRNKELQAIISLSEPNYYTGMHFLMSIISPSIISESFIRDGVNFTMGYPAIALYLFGYIGIIPFQIFISFIVSIIIIYLIYSITCNNIIHLILSCKLLMMTYDSLTTGNLYVLFSKESLLVLCLILITLKPYATRHN